MSGLPRLRVGRREATSVILSVLSFFILYASLATGWRSGEGTLSVTILAEAGSPINIRIHLPPAFDAQSSISKLNAESVRSEASTQDILIHGVHTEYLVTLESGEIDLLEPFFNVMKPLPLNVASLANVTVYIQLLAIAQTRVGPIASYSNVHAAQFDREGVAFPLYENYSNEKLRVRDCIIYFSLTVSLVIFAVSSQLLRTTWASRFPFVTLILTSNMFGLYIFAGTGLDILVGRHFELFDRLIVLALGSLLHTSFSHLFNNLFFGFLPAGIAFESGLRWKRRRTMVELYLASFFFVNFLFTAISYPIHGIPPIGASYPIISLATVLVCLLFIFREKILSDAVEKKVPARLIALCACGAYPLLRGVYDWMGYMIEYPSNWNVVTEGASHLLVFGFTLFIIYSAKDHLAKENPILGI